MQTVLGQGGTVFRLYFPRIDEEEDSPEEPESGSSVPHGKETILLVEDEPAVRDLSAKILRGKGYTVIEATLPTEAMAIATDSMQIDLLVTDVVMPYMNGRDVADALCDERPDLKVLFVSGYTADKVVQHNVLDADAPFLAKPFSANGLAQKVREVLDGPPERSRPGRASPTTPSEAA